MTGSLHVIRSRTAGITRIRLSRSAQKDLEEFVRAGNGSTAPGVSDPNTRLGREKISPVRLLACKFSRKKMGTNSFRNRLKEQFR